MELQRLPGIGPVLAGRIIDQRSKEGQFRTLDDLDNVPGIGPILLENIKPFIVFEDSSAKLKNLSDNR